MKKVVHSDQRMGSRTKGMSAGIQKRASSKDIDESEGLGLVAS